MDSVGIRMSVRGISPAIMARRVSNETLRRMGPMTKPMNRSIPVHRAPVITCTKFRNQRLGLKTAAVITAKAAAAATRYQARSGAAARTGWTVEMMSAKSMIPQVGFETTVTRDPDTAKRAPAT